MDVLSDPASRKTFPAPVTLALVIVCLLGLGIAMYESWFASPFRNADFVVYYAAARVAAQGGDPYDRAQIRDEQVRQGVDSDIREYLYSSSFLVVLQPLAALSLRNAHRVFMVLTWAAFAGSLLLLWRTLKKIPLLVMAAAAVWFTPLWSNLTLTQANAFILLSIAACLCLDTRRHPYLAGVALAPGILLKFTPALLLVYFLIRRQWRALAGTAAAIAALELVSMLCFRTLLDVKIIDGLLQHSDRKLLYPENLGLPSVLARAAGDNAAQLLPWVLAAVAVLTIGPSLLMLWRHRHAGHDAGLQLFGLLVTTMLLVPTLAFGHHLVNLMIPLAIIAVTLAGPLRKGLSGLFPGLLAVFAISLLLIEAEYWRVVVALGLVDRGWWSHPATWGLLLLWLLQMTLLLLPELRRFPVLAPKASADLE